jgi:alkaline phosphatase D
MNSLFERRYAASRRQLIQGLGFAGAAMLLPLGRGALAQVKFASDPYRLGVASGDPVADGFVIWTRLAPEPMAIGNGMPGAPVEVEWEVGDDAAFSKVVKSGKTVARPELAHSVHVEVDGLMPDRPYWYRFTAGGSRSPVGRARTTPAAGAAVKHLRFGVAGCQHYEEGFFTGYRYLAKEDVDFVFCYGDYIYEYHVRPRRQPDGSMANPPRLHAGGQPYSLDEYRRHYAQYKMDPDLQAVHAAHSWFATWDDHEIEDNWTGEADKEHTPPEVFALHKQAAAQAFYENMPLRAKSFPVGPSIQLYRQADWGNLARLNFLDTRQYRTDQPCDDKFGTTCPDINSLRAEVMGRKQEAWLTQGLTTSHAKWNVLAQQVMMMDLDRNATHGVNTDSWAAYRTPRNRLLSQIQKGPAKNVIVLTGDEHKNYAGELHLDGHKPGKQPIAVEFVGTSISSGGNGSDTSPDTDAVMAVNTQQLKFINSQRGYFICDLTPERWVSEFKVLDRVTTPDGKLSTRAKWAVESGKAKLVQA